jgi:hypothetical protein
MYISVYGPDRDKNWRMLSFGYGVIDSYDRLWRQMDCRITFVLLD